MKLWQIHSLLTASSALGYYKIWECKTKQKSCSALKPKAEIKGSSFINKLICGNALTWKLTGSWNLNSLSSMVLISQWMHFWGPALCSIDKNWNIASITYTRTTEHRTAVVALGVIWRLLFSRDTSVFSTIEMLHDIALYKLTIDIDIDTHTQPFYCSYGTCSGPPGWAGTRKVKPGRLKPTWIYWSKRHWVAVASAGLYASLHLIPDNHANIPPLSFLQAGCPYCRPTNSVKALKAKTTEHAIITYQYHALIKDSQQYP